MDGCMGRHVGNRDLYWHSTLQPYTSTPHTHYRLFIVSSWHSALQPQRHYCLITPRYSLGIASSLYRLKITILYTLLSIASLSLLCWTFSLSPHYHTLLSIIASLLDLLFIASLSHPPLHYRFFVGPSPYRLIITPSSPLSLLCWTFSLSPCWKNSAKHRDVLPANSASYEGKAKHRDRSKQREEFRIF